MTDLYKLDPPSQLFVGGHLLLHVGVHLGLRQAGVCHYVRTRNLEGETTGSAIHNILSYHMPRSLICAHILSPDVWWYKKPKEKSGTKMKADMCVHLSTPLILDPYDPHIIDSWQSSENVLQLCGSHLDRSRCRDCPLLSAPGAPSL